jgi:glycosyltransferase involved in cell wall biosynthesis
MCEDSLLTAILFTYNHKDSIAKCIESLVEQDTTFKYEIHIWDDCSFDGTSDICSEYAKKYPDKIKLTIQKENTFLKEDLKLQSYAAIRSIKTKYFCVIDGDDYWCDKNKVQIALSFLEENPDYVGFAHDTVQVNKYDNTSLSYIHDLTKSKVENPVTLNAKAPFFLTSSRIFRTFDYPALKILPIDYLVYYYHLSKGPVYYYDKIMGSYVIGENSTFANNGNIIDLNAMFPYRLSLMFNFTQDKFCTELLKEFDTRHHVGLHRYWFLMFCKSLFGVRIGWKLWATLLFVWRFGRDSLNVNYVYDRKTAKKNSDLRSAKNSIELKSSVSDREILKEDSNCQGIEVTEKTNLNTLETTFLHRTSWHYVSTRFMWFLDKTFTVLWLPIRLIILLVYSAMQPSVLLRKIAKGFKQPRYILTIFKNLIS